MRSLSSGSFIVTLTIGVVSIVQLVPAESAWTLLPLFLFLGIAVFLRSASAIHITLFCLLLVCIPITSHALRLWPFRLLVPLAGYHAIVFLFAGLRRSYGGFQLGRISQSVRLFMLVTIMVSASALVGWYLLLKPDLHIYLRQFPEMPLPAIPFAGFGFAGLNAVMEELAFRGIIMNGLQRAVGSFPTANLFQAAAFGFFHYQAGFPKGIMGVVMTFIYGLLLGVIRGRSNGLAAPVLTHFFADLVIFSILILFR